MTAARFALTSLTAAALTVLSGHAMALGLGRLSVLSALGEPLRAEIDVTSLSSEEASTLQLRVAPPEAYRAAGVDYNSVLSGTQVSLARRADGRPYMRVVSDRVVTEPFVDVILEMTWASGRLVREYTLLLDPPKTAAEPAAPSAAPVFAPPARTAPSASPAPRAPAPATADAPVASASAARRTPRPAAQPRTATAAPAAAASAAPAGSGVKVLRGDTLTAIAVRNQPAGVSLDQMLVSLFRGNPQAFVGNNMNRLRAGAVLTVPSADEAKAIPAGEARETIVAQSADFDAYRRKLASGVPAAADAPARQATGRVQAAVEDRKQAAAPTPDKLKLSQGAVQSGAAAEATISREAAAKEASTRVAELSRNVEELRKLQSASTPAPAASVPAAAAAPAPAPAVPPAASAPALPSVSAPTGVTAPPPAPASAAVAAAPASVPAAAAKAAPPIAQPEEPGFVDSILSSPFMLPGAGILLLVLGAFGFYRARAGGRKAAGETSFLESRLQPDSFFGASGGQRVDTHDGGGTSISGNSQSSSSMSYSLSQLDAIGDVDPVAEADVYLAYGRDLQAEEILKEAMRATPDRLAIRTKLLEVYAKRRDTKGFELLATQLYALTQGVGAEWNAAQELGRSIDPDNALYQPGGEPDALLQDGDRFIEPLGASTLPQSVMPSPSMFATAPGSLESELPAGGPVDLDLDLGFESAAPAIEPPAPSMPEQTLPFAPEPQAPEPAPEFDGVATELPDFSAQELPSKPYETTSVSGQGAAAPAAMPVDALDFDLADISLDLDAPAPTSAQPAAADAPKTDSSYVDFDLPEGPDSRFNEEGDPLERKMELADEFRQIGDLEGARDLLEEVVAQADGALKTKAQNMLDSLG